MTLETGASRALNADPATDCLLAGRDVKLQKALTLILLPPIRE